MWASSAFQELMIEDVFIMRYDAENRGEQVVTPGKVWHCPRASASEMSGRCVIPHIVSSAVAGKAGKVSLFHETS